MGNSESKFREAIRAGDHSKAYELYYNKKVIRENIDPTELCYEGTSSILHYTALHAMQPLYEEFLDTRRVSPLILDETNKRSCIHLMCSQSTDPDVRLAMLTATLNNEFVKSVLSRAISGADIDGNTPLHFACLSGLQDCVQLLIDNKADPSVTNNEGQTPVDMATTANHLTIAKRLETLIVFSEPTIDYDNGGVVIEMDPPSLSLPLTINHVAMKDQEIQTMKDELLIETSELLGISLFTAEALLRKYEWSKEQLLEAWMSDPAGTCDKAGVDLPPVLTLDNIDESVKGGAAGFNRQPSIEIDCSICYLPIDDLVKIQCEHTFCKDCWQQYLHDKIKNGQIHNIVCPEYACYKLIPIQIVEKLVSRDMALKYLQFDIKAFVDSNPNIRWCPHPGCGQAIKKPTSILGDDPLWLLESEVTASTGTTTTATKPTGITVHCGQDHYFCWDCGQTAHEPCTCEEWGNWLRKIKEMQVKIGSMSSNDFGEAATSQWISLNSKPCPNCRTPIEKNDGCNHMKCGKCRHDFCWMCLDPWNKHNSSTGGYFDCNRFKVIEKIEEMLRQRKEDSENYEKVSHFQHYYDRYQNHKHSLQLETGYLKSAGDKMIALQLSAQEEGSDVGSVQFVEEAVRTLVEARLTIAASYGYGYFLLIVPVRDTFEKLQGELEEQVESLAEVVARPHLRKPKVEIIKLTHTVMNKRAKFVKTVQKELIKPPVPPRYSPWIPPPPPSTSDYMRERREQVRREREAVEAERRKAEEEEERLIQEALQASKEQYDEDTQLQSDTEFAIMLSMGNNNSDKLSNSLPHFSSLTPPQEDTEEDEQQFVVINRGGGVAGGGVNFPFSSPSQNSDQLSDPVIPSKDVINNDNKIDLEHWRHKLLHGNDWAPSSSSSSSSDPVSPLKEIKPSDKTNNNIDNDFLDEDIATAIALSLSTMKEEDVTMMNDLNITTESDSSSSSRVGLSHYNNNNNNQLQDVLHSTTRKAANV